MAIMNSRMREGYVGTLLQGDFVAVLPRRHASPRAGRFDIDSANDK